MVFGISIGNTSVSSAVSQSNRVSVIANAGGEHRPRSVAAKSNEDGFSVGTAAINSRNTVLFDNIVKTFEQEGGKFTLTKQSGGLTINTRVDSCLGALITEISETCRDALSSGDSAVLAVPDHWTEAQCEEFKNIFEQVSKFTIQRTLSRSAAAWLATKQNGNLGDLKQSGEIIENEEKQTVLVIRVGGTSASATILEDYNGIIQTIETFVSEEGADLVVRSICDMLTKEANRKLRCDISESKKSVQKIEKEARRAVEVLSNKETVAVQIESLFEGMDFQGNIVRGRVEGLTPYKNILNPLFDKLTDKSVDRVIVVGGGAKSPKIQSLIRSKFDKSEVVIAPNCESLVPLGCAIQAHIINASNDVSCDTLPTKLALSPISLTLNGAQSKTSLISKFSPLPVSFSANCDEESVIICPQIQTEPVLTGCEGHVTGTFTEKGLFIKNNDKNFELLF